MGLDEILCMQFERVTSLVEDHGGVAGGHYVGKACYALNLQDDTRIPNMRRNIPRT